MQCPKSGHYLIKCFTSSFHRKTQRNPCSDTRSTSQFDCPVAKLVNFRRIFTFAWFVYNKLNANILIFRGKYLRSFPYTLCVRTFNPLQACAPMLASGGACAQRFIVCTYDSQVCKVK